MKPKKIFLVSFLTVVSVFSIAIIMQSCEKHEIDYILDIPEEYNEVGKLHNQGLDFIFEKIKKESIALVQENESSSFKSAKTLDYKAIVHERTLEFCKTNNKLKDNYLIFENALNLSKPRINSTGLKSMTTDGLSTKQVDLINKIYESLEKKYSKKDINKLKEDLDRINQVAAKDLTKEEAAVIYCATSTAYNSYQYWMNKYKKWYFAINYPEILEKYNEAELNNMQIKNGMKSATAVTYDLPEVIVYGTKPKPDGETFNAIEDWWEDTGDVVENWWDDHGENVVKADIIGAAYGAFKGFVTAGTDGFIFGPEGAVVAGTAGAITGSVVGAIECSALGAIGEEIDLW